MPGRDTIIFKHSLTKEMPSTQNRHATPVRVKQILRQNTSLMTDKTDNRSGYDLNGESSEADGGQINKHLVSRKLKNPQEISFLTSPSPLVGKATVLPTQPDEFDLNKPNHTRGRENRMDIPKEYRVDENMSFKFFYQKFKNPIVRGNSLNPKFLKGQDRQESPQLNFSLDTVQRPRKTTLTKIDEVDHKHEPRLNITFQSTANIPGQVGEYDQGRRRGRTLPKKPSDGNVEIPSRGGTRVNTTEGEQHNNIKTFINGSRKEYGRSPKKPVKPIQVMDLLLL